jgi:selenocysteine-specific elongation factor
MRSLIVGTAGHIDHGKSALVQALTGTDPDRLKEEKERGITIDLGFAHAELGEGITASFVDVPGHERFVRNMLAGAHGIHAVMLVVAADESVMPQTREHFHICRLLGIPRGLIALSKCDLADEEMQALAEEEVRGLVAGSFLEGAPVLRVSARTGQGVAALRDALAGLAAATRPPAADGLLRLPLDRAFVLRGFGTVVTGTLVSGRLRVGEEVELLPSGRRARVRGLQVHGAATEVVEAGHRTACNLAGIEVSEVARGDVVARPGTLRPSSLLDVRLTLLAGEKPLADQARVRVHVASAEVLARVRLQGAEKLEPGASVRAQLRLERPAVAGRGDRLVVRAYSPAVTIGGAEVLDPLAPKRRRREPMADLGRPAEEPPARAARLMIEAAGAAGVDAGVLAARVTVPLAELPQLLAAVPEVVAVGKEPGAYLSRAALQGMRAETRAVLERFHVENPLKAAMPREELRRRAFARAPAGAFEQVLESMAAAGELRPGTDVVALAGHEVRLTAEEQSVRAALLDLAAGAGLQGLEPGAAAAGGNERVRERIARVLVSEGQLQKVGDGLVHHRALEAMKEEVRRRWPPGSRLDVAAFKEMTGLSRKYVIPLLEYLDRERVTRRSGNDRVVLGAV